MAIVMENFFYELNEFIIPWVWVAVIAVIIFLTFKNFLLAKKSNTPFSIEKILSITLFCASIFFGSVFVWLTHHINYVQGTDVGIVKTTKAEYVGFITKHPFHDAMTVLTTPKYPILNCPNYVNDEPSCTQELIKINKSDIISIEIFD